MENLTMESIIDIKVRGCLERVALKDFYNEEVHVDEDNFLTYIGYMIQSGRATVVDTRDTDEKIADKITEEILAIEKAKAHEQDRVDRANHKATSLGLYKKVGFPAKTLIDAQEMHQQLIRNFNIRIDQLGVNMDGGKIVVTITDCPVKTYMSIERHFGFKRATEAVSGVVDKTANTVVTTADMTINNIAVPVAKTAISTTAKVAKSLFGFGAKLGGIAVGEVSKATKQTIEEIKTDGYIAEAKGEVVSGVHAVRRAINTRTGSGYGGIIIE